MASRPRRQSAPPTPDARISPSELYHNNPALAFYVQGPAERSAFWDSVLAEYGREISQSVEASRGIISLANSADPQDSNEDSGSVSHEEDSSLVVLRASGDSWNEDYSHTETAVNSESEADAETAVDSGSEADYEAFADYMYGSEAASEAAVDSGAEADSEALTNPAPQATFIPRAPGDLPMDRYMFTIEEIVHIFLRHEYDEDEERPLRFLSILVHWPHPEARPVSKCDLETAYLLRARNYHERIAKQREWRQINEWFCEDDFTPTWRPMQLARQRAMQETDEPVAVDH